MKTNVTNEFLSDILSSWDIDFSKKSIEPYGHGHINLTFLVTTPEKRYILQRINQNVFRNPVQKPP